MLRKGASVLLVLSPSAHGRLDQGPSTAKEGQEIILVCNSWQQKHHVNFVKFSFTNLDRMVCSNQYILRSFKHWSRMYVLTAEESSINTQVKYLRIVDLVQILVAFNH